VAQALHRKANKAEVDAALMKKAELSDLQRVVAALESKIDIPSFEALVRAVEVKADRHELSALPSSFRNDKETDRFDMDRRISDLEKQSQLLNRDLSLQTEQIKSLVNLNLSQKADLREIDNLQHALINKADISKVSELVSQLRNEVVTQMGTIKKDF
jgi:hypothetical protein